MYELIWRILPGPIWLKIILALGLLAAVVYVLFTVVFPWADVTFNISGTSVE